MAVIAVIATLDTKGAEAAFLKQTIEKMGCSVLLIDSGMGAAPTITPDLARDAVFAEAGVSDCRAYLAEQGKAATQDKMREGLQKTLRRLHDEGRIQGILSVGGAQGTAISTAAMQGLPIGFPKVMVSTVACGSAQFDDYVGNRDIAMIPSIADICGLNSITIPVFASGCGAVVGGDFASHALEHEIGGIYDVAHGAGLAAIWGSWARYVYKDCLPRFEKFAMNVMQVDPEGTADDVALRGIEAMEDFYREIKMPTSIHELGIDPGDDELKLMAHKCSIGCKGSKGSAKVLHEEDMYEIYKAAL